MEKKLTKRALHTQENLLKVLDASITLFNERGFEHTKMSDICRETGLSNGSVYHMFGSKDEILRRIYDRYINVSCGLTDNMEQKLDDPYTHLLQHVTDVMALWQRTGPMMIINKFRWTSSRTMLGCSPIQREELTSFISAAQRRGTFLCRADAALIVEFIFTLQRGLLYGWTIRDDFDLEAYAALFWPPVLRGLVSGTTVFPEVKK